MSFREKGRSIGFLPVTQFLAERSESQTFACRLTGLLFQGKRLVPQKAATSGESSHLSFLPHFRAKLEFIGLQFFHRLQVYNHSNKKAKFQPRCALYPRPEDRGLTARGVKREKLKFLRLLYYRPERISGKKEKKTIGAGYRIFRPCRSDRPRECIAGLGLSVKS
jgi:hypothetical protein